MTCKYCGKEINACVMVSGYPLCEKCNRDFNYNFLKSSSLCDELELFLKSMKMTKQYKQVINWVLEYYPIVHFGGLYWDIHLKIGYSLELHCLTELKSPELVEIKLVTRNNEIMVKVIIQNVKTKTVFYVDKEGNQLDKIVSDRTQKGVVEFMFEKEFKNII